MTTQEYLSMPDELHKKIVSDVRKLESYKDLASSISSPQFGEKVQGTHSTDAPFVHYLSKIDAIEKEISVEKQKLEELKVTIDAQIDLLDSEKEQCVLRYRYLMFMRMSRIAAEMHYSKRRVQQIHAAALKIFERFHPISPPFHL